MAMTLQEAIDHATEQGIQLLSRGCNDCGVEHMQLADWLRQLQVYYKEDNVHNDGWDVSETDDGETQTCSKLSPNDSILRVRLMETKPFSPSTICGLIRGYNETIKKTNRKFPIIGIAEIENGNGKYVYDMSVILTDNSDIK